MKRNENGKRGIHSCLYWMFRTAQQEMEAASSEMDSYKEKYLSGIQPQILLLQNQLLLEPENSEIKVTIAEYAELITTVEQGTDSSSENPDVQNSFNQYKKSYSGLSEKNDISKMKIG